MLLVEVKASRAGRCATSPTVSGNRSRRTGAIVASTDDGQAFLVVNFGESLVSRGLDAAQLVRELGKHIGGGGGGRPTLAEAGGRNPEGVKAALEAGRRAVADALA